MKKPWVKPVDKSQTRTNNNNRKIYDSARWRTGVRIQKINQTPYCEVCMLNDILKEAREIDHIKQISEGGDPFDIENLQSLCVSCHAKKSALEGLQR